MNDETTIRDLITRWVEAIQAQDLEGVLVDHDPNIVMFDVPPPYNGVRGIDEYRKSWPPFFDWLRQGARFQLLELDVMLHSPMRCCAAAHRRSSRPTPTTGCGSPSACARTTAAGSLCTNIIRSRWWTRPRNPRNRPARRLR